MEVIIIGILLIFYLYQQVRSPSNKDTDLEDDESRVSPRKIVVNPVKRVRRLQVSKIPYTMVDTSLWQ